MVFLGNVLNIQSSKSKEESSKRIVIHLGSSNLLIGLILLGGYFNALGLNTDSIPISIPAVVARRRRIKKESVNNHVALDTDDIDEWVGVIQPFVKHRMKLNLLKYPNMMSQVVAYNEIEQPQIIQEFNDPDKIEWIQAQENVVFGHDANHLSNPAEFLIRHPIRNGELNLWDYTSKFEVLNDLEGLWNFALSKLDLTANEFKSISVLLIIPDLFHRDTIKSLIDILLLSMNFHSVAIMQEAVCATFGAGVSYACVVDVGSQKTSISCVDEGYLIPDSRINLKYGGDDITRAFYNLLIYRDKFNYRDALLSKSVYDWAVLESLKEHYCTLLESEIAVQLYNCHVRSPGAPTKKYMFKTYDSAIFAPLSLFFPNPKWMRRNDMGGIKRTRCFDNDDFPDEVKENYPRYKTFNTWVSGLPMHYRTDAKTWKERWCSIQNVPKPVNSENKKVLWNQENIQLSNDDAQSIIPIPIKNEAIKETKNTVTEMEIDVIEEGKVEEEDWLPLDNAIVMSIANTAGSLVSHYVKIAQKLLLEREQKLNGEQTEIQSNILVPAEFLELPKDEEMPDINDPALNDLPIGDEKAAPALNTIVFTPHEERIKRLLNSVLLVGGGLSLISGIAPILESRIVTAFHHVLSQVFELTNTDTTLFNLHSCRVMPIPRELDPRSVIWKGGSVASRLDVVKESWIDKEEWEIFGFRLIKERNIMCSGL